MKSSIERWFQVSSVLTLFVLFWLNDATAADLNSAGRSYVSTLQTFVQVTAVGGILAGAGLCQIPGGDRIGKPVMKGGAVAAVCAFAAPTLMSLLKNVFG